MLMVYKGGLAFANNPITVAAAGAPDSMSLLRGMPYHIYYGGDQPQDRVFSGCAWPPCEIDVSEVARSVASYIPVAAFADDVTPVAQVLDATALLDDRRLLVTIGPSGDEAELSCVVLPGGVSKQNYRRLQAAGADAFAARFAREDCNFFLTTRTAGWRVMIRETELAPLYFLNMSEGYLTMSIVDPVSGHNWDTDGTYEKGVLALDVDRLRRWFFVNHGVLPSVFDIYRNGATRVACRIEVVGCRPAPERYRLKFRNSLGVFDVMELAGAMSVAPTVDGVVFDRYDPATGDFSARRERAEVSRVLSVDTGEKRPDEVAWLQDMLASDEVYLLDWAPDPVRVVPSADEMSYMVRPTAPKGLTLKLEVAERDMCVLPDISGCDDAQKPHLFSDEFDDKFD